MKLNINRELLKGVLKENKITYSKLAEIFNQHGIPLVETSIKLWFRKTNPNTPDLQKIVFLSNYFEIPLDNLLIDSPKSLDGLSKVDIFKIPIVGEASCGLPISNDCQANEFTYVPKDFYEKGMYAIRASGNSMSPDIENSDIVICNPNSQILNGDLVHHELFAENAIKVFIKDKQNNIQFKPLNHSPNFMTLTILANDKDMLDNLKMSKVVRIIKDIENSRTKRLRLLGVNQ